MAASSIELRWGRGYESVEARESARGVLKEAAALATEGLTSYGISFEGVHRAVVQQVTPDVKAAGRATTARTFYMTVSPNKWKRPQMQLLHLSCIMVHELVHCKRMETFATTNMMEFAATEGLAYNTEKKFRVDFAPWYRAKGIVATIGEFSEEKIRGFREPFLETFANKQDWDWDSYWEQQRVAYKWGLNRSELVGIHAVGQRLTEGRDLVDLINLSANEVLGHETTA